MCTSEHQLLGPSAPLIETKVTVASCLGREGGATQTVLTLAAPEANSRDWDEPREMEALMYETPSTPWLNTNQIAPTSMVDCL